MPNLDDGADAPLMTAGAFGLVQHHGRLWAIDNAAAHAYLEVLAGIDIAAHLKDDTEPRTRADAKRTSSGGWVDADETPYKVLGGGIAVLSIDGPMTKKPSSMSYLFGGTSTVLLRQELRQARLDPDVKSAIILIDSPGGSAAGTSDLGDEIRAFAAVKPIIAYVPDQCASAALWAASQCDLIIVGPAAWSGSIGVYGGMRDTSRATENAGVRVVLVTSGGVKGAGFPGTAITDAHVAEMQREIDVLTGQFVGAVARGRGLDEAAVRAMATGQMFDAADALDRGLVDAVLSYDKVLELLASGDWPGELAARITSAPDPDLPPRAELPDTTPPAYHGPENTPQAGTDGTTTPRAGSPGREDPPMPNFSMDGLKKLIAGLRPQAKTEEEKAAVAALETEATAAESLASENDELKAQIEQLRSAAGASAEQVLKQEAQTFALGLVGEGRITAAEANDVVDGYLQAHADDAKDGGKRLEKLKAREGRRAAGPKLTAETIDPDSSVSASNPAETVLKALLSRETTPAASNRGDHEALDAASSDKHTLSPKAMTDDERKAAVAKARRANGTTGRGK